MRLLAERYRVYALDLPGHGACASVRFEYEHALRTLERFLRDEVRRPALLAGVSLGGCLAMDLAGTHGDLVAGLALSGSTFDARGLICKLVLTGESVVFPRAERRLIHNLHEFARRQLPADAAEAIISGGSYWHAAAAAVRQLRGRDFPASLRRYDGPVLILNGRRDWVHRTAERAFARASAPNPGGRVYVCRLAHPLFSSVAEKISDLVMRERHFFPQDWGQGAD
jgi:pimeloyl-ACP methyl ester carboxylesterase